MLPAERVIADEGLTVAGGIARVEIRLPWYRSLPVSTVCIERVAIDGESVPLDRATFELGDFSVPVDALQDSTDRFWFVLDSAFVCFPARMLPGSEHRVDVTIILFPPYIPGMRRMISQSELLSAGEAR